MFQTYNISLSDVKDVVFYRSDKSPGKFLSCNCNGGECRWIGRDLHSKIYTNRY